MSIKTPITLEDGDALCVAKIRDGFHFVPRVQWRFERQKRIKPGELLGAATKRTGP